MRHRDSDVDRAHMARAIAVAERARGRSTPNPGVGCVLAVGDEVVAEAATDVAGGPHAEAAALALAGPRAAGVTAYVTLEPCAHHGRTPPCTQALIDARVARVVHALDDPHPVAGGGAETLRRAGVAVCGGLYAEWVAPQLEGFTTLVATGRPHVTLKLAQGVDGRLEPGPDHPGRRWLTGPGARRAVHRSRAAADAVLVGVGTVLADDPRLDVRHVPTSAGQPRPVVLDSRLRTPVDAAVTRPGAVVLTGPAPDATARGDLERAGVEVVPCPLGDDGRLDLPRALERLARLGIVSVLAEPGRTLARALVAADLVDRLVLHVAGDLGDGPLRPAVPTDGWITTRLGGVGEDVVLELTRP